MNIKLVKEYWILADKEKEYFLSVDEDYCDWEPKIDLAAKFPSESGATHFNNTRVYDLVEKHEVSPVKVTQTFEY